MAKKKKSGKQTTQKAKLKALFDAHNLIAEFVATDSGCLDQVDAAKLVFSCTGVGPVNPDTRLGQLFPGQTQRRGFCGCVFNKARMAGSDVTPGEIPCTPSTTVGDVIASISC